MKKIVSVMLVFVIILSTFTNAFASKTPSFNKLVKEYEKAVDYLSFTCAVKENIGRKGNVTSIATAAYESYKRYTLDRSYTLQDFMDHFEIIARTGYEVKSSKFKLAARTAASIAHIRASRNLKNAENKLREYYPEKAKKYFREISGGSSGGGGSTRRW